MGRPATSSFLAGAAAAVLATVLTLGLGEIAIRVVTSRRLDYNIEMVKYARELKQRDPRGVVSHVHRPSRRARLMGVDVSLNSLGDRGPELVEPKLAGTRRILVLGSSVTMGWGVRFDQVFTTVAERRLNSERPFGADVRFEIVNAGIGNYSTAFQRELFRDQYPRVAPDAVILNYFISDAQPRTMGRDNAILKYSSLAAWLFDRVSQWRFSREGRDLYSVYADLYADGSSAWQTTLAQITAMRDACAADGRPFIVMIVPDIHDLSPGTPYAALYTKMGTAFRAAGLTTFSTFDAFQQRFGADVTSLWIQADDPHPNASGHQVMADALVTFLTGADPLHLKR